MDSPDSTTRILFVGDMHLGRSPGGVPDRVIALSGLSLRELGPAAAWRRVVDTAVSLGTDAVALAGDLVEGDNARFEALGHLTDGMRRLAAAGIAVVAVAGNHDTEALPHLADRIAGFILLGRGGTWSGTEVGRDPVVRLVGWSFPASRHDESPLASAPPAPDPGRPTFGLLHGDLDGSGNTHYAPVKSANLMNIGYRGWFMGHVHKPGDTNDAGRPFYLGSLTGLDVSETGAHGPVLLEVDGAGHYTARRLPLAPLRWEHRDLHFTGDAGTMRAILEDAATAVAQEVQAGHPDLGALGLRFTLVGETDDPAGIDRAARGLEPGELVSAVDGTTVFVDRVVSRMTARVDLAELARRSDPPGLLARRILALEDPAADVADILAGARRALERKEHRYFKGLAQEWIPGDGDLRAMLAAIARRTLTEILAQSADDREARHAAG